MLKDKIKPFEIDSLNTPPEYSLYKHSIYPCVLPIETHWFPWLLKRNIPFENHRCDNQTFSNYIWWCCLLSRTNDLQLTTSIISYVRFGTVRPVGRCKFSIPLAFTEKLSAWLSLLEIYLAGMHVLIHELPNSILQSSWAVFVCEIIILALNPALPWFNEIWFMYIKRFL